MRKIVLTIVATLATIVAGTSIASAQDYKSSVGLSLGGNIGINAKFKVSESSAIETGIDHTFYLHDAVNLFAVWQYHLPLAEGLYGYAGAGFNIGAQNLGYYDGADFNFGLDPNVGIEYRFNKTPIVLGVDYRPSINIVGASLWSNLSIKLRFVF